MKKYEKIILVLTAGAFCLQILPFEDIWIPFRVITYVLVLSYFFGGIWLFNSNWKDKKILLPIIAGIALGISIFPLPPVLQWYNNNMFYFYPIPNAILCISLMFYVIIKRKTNKITIDTKRIFKRSVIILIICSFFVYTPKETFVPYRMLLKALNSQNYLLINNILMIEYREKSEKALGKGDCDKAIEYALKANESGKIWLGLENKTWIDSLINLSDENALHLSNIKDELYSIEYIVSP